MITFPTDPARLAHDPAYTELYTGPYEDTVTGKEWEWKQALLRWEPYHPVPDVIIESETAPENENLKLWGNPATGEFYWFSPTNDAWMGLAVSGGGGTTLTSYAAQIATLGDHPPTFPPTIGNGAEDAVAGNDARLTDTRKAYELDFGATTQQFRAYSDAGTATFTIGTSAASAFRTALGAGGPTGDALFTAATVAAANSAIGIQYKERLADVQTTSTSYSDITGLTGFALDANAFYQIEFFARVDTVGVGGYLFQMSTTEDLSPAAATEGMGVNYNASTGAVMSQTGARALYLFGRAVAATGKHHFSTGFFRTGAASCTASIQIAMIAGGTSATFKLGFARITKLS